MSTITLDRLKKSLQVIHDLDDEMLQDLLDAAEREALNFMDRKYLPVPEDQLRSECASEVDPISENETATEGSLEVEQDVYLGIVLMVKAAYENRDADPVRGALDLPKYRERAEQLWMPYRKGLGV